MPELDFMVTADYVRAEGGMLHMIAAGVDTLLVRSVPAAQPLGVGLRMLKRGITEQQIYTALGREQRRTPGEPGTIWVHGIVPGDATFRESRILKVCIPVDRSRIVTAAWRDSEGRHDQTEL
jgi:hypothetical protein